jgi:peptidoglycan DL-endopeptidase CwlO
VPSPLTAGFAARLREVAAMAGTGPPPSAASALTGIHRALTDVAAVAGRNRQRTAWVGDAGDAASEFTRSTVAAIDAVAGSTEGIGGAAAGAADAVAQARARLQAIVDEFEAHAAALEARLDEPGVAEQLIDEGHRAIAEATAVVDDLRATLDAQGQAVATHSANPAAALGAQSGGGIPGMGMPSLGGAGGGLGSALGSGLGSGSGSGSGAGSPGLAAGQESAFGGHAADAAPHATDPAAFGDGVAVRLPDGSTVTAPNDVAASAVRHALTQLGVQYRWGGEAPGVAMDCSGLTQWAYHEAGLDLPRLAQEQDIGTAVARGALRPGDLAVWDGHVAMVVGNNTMIEAGDPVHLSPIRTTNAGQGFQGFWRPTD